jgi:hypothetical protein
MTRSPRRYLGDLDAATDDHLMEYFVESDDLARLLNGDSDIIYGAKGAGKTALRRALSERNRSSFFAVRSVDLDNISFAQVHDALSKLRHTTATEVPTLASNIWRNVLAMYYLEAIADEPEIEKHGGLKQRILDALTAEGFLMPDSNSRILGAIERILVRIAEAGLKHPGPTPLGLSAQQRQVANRFPASPEIAELLKATSKIVALSGNPVLICVDGFDSIVDHSPESRKAIFAGLIDAIQKGSRDPMLAKSVAFKAFLPKELTDGAHALVWDSDKHILNIHQLTWTERALEEFARKRLSRVTKAKSLKFSDIWHEVMPEKIRNETHKLDEASFAYILRHTLYRPRQLLTHLQRLLDKWDERGGHTRLDPSFIPQVVGDTNRMLAESMVSQLGIRYPHFLGFIRSWRGVASILTLAEFRARLARLMNLGSEEEVSEVGLALFRFGIFGVGARDQVLRGGQTARFRYAFVGDLHDDVYKQADGEDLVALSPMFFEYCGSQVSEYGAIVPSQ